MAMTVLVTGATGFVGSWIVRELVAAGHHVRALVRPTARLDNLEGLVGVERAAGDVLDRASIDRALVGCDAVVHTAGIAHFLADNIPRMYDVNVRGVEIVLGAAASAGITRAVLTSSTAAVGGSRTPRVCDESTPSTAEELGIHYFVSKFRGEQAALSLARKGFPVTILKPVVLLGPGDIYHSSATTFLALASHKLPVVVAGGASFCDVRDVARAHVVALEKASPGETYLLGGHNLEVAEMTRRVAAFAGVAPPRVVPFPLAYAVATVAELTAKALHRKSDLSRDLVRAARLYTWVDSSRARRDLGYVIRPFDDSLADTLRFFLANGRLKASTPQLRALASSAPPAVSSSATLTGSPSAH